MEETTLPDNNQSPAASAAIHKPCIMTVNVADYFQVGTLRGVIKQDRWVRFETRLEANTQRTLDLLEKYQTKATFFILGWIATELPGVVREVVRRGHEVASLGYLVRTLREHSPLDFKREVVKAKEALEGVTGTQVRGFRIPQGWITCSDGWVARVLSEAGYQYDSSLRPFLRVPKVDRWRCFVHCENIGGKEFWEFPLPSINFGGCFIPIAGGNYHRQAPVSVMRHAVSRWRRTSDSPYLMYFHVWEMDPDQPRVTGAPFLQRVRQYRNLDRMSDVIEDYLQRYQFIGIGRYLRIEPEKVQPENGVGLGSSAILSSGPGTVAPRGHIVPFPGTVNDTATCQPVTIVVPCHNEEKVVPYLSKTLESVRSLLSNEYDVRFVFVDDCSKDRTWDALKEAFGGRPECLLIRHPVNLGVAAAILTGVREAETEIVCSIDCDCSYDPHQLREMLRMMRPGVDLVTASPYHPDGAVLNVPRWRLALSRSLSSLYRLVLSQDLATYTSCFRVYRRRSVANLRISNTGFLGVTETLVRLHQRGCRIVECPAVLEGRLFGESKMKIVRTILGHLRLLARTFFENMTAKKIASPLLQERGQGGEVSPQNEPRF